MTGLAQETDPPLVEAVRFSGNTHFSDTALRRRIRTAPNRRFLGIGGLNWWRWLYKVGDSGILGSRIGNVLIVNGEPPAWLDPAAVASDAEQLRLYYVSGGFRDAQVHAQISTTNGRAQVQFDINPGTPTHIRRVSYVGLDSLDAEQRRDVVRNSLLASDEDNSSGLTYRVRRLRFSEALLVDERRRLLALLRDAGYAAVTRDSIRAVIIPATPDSFDVALRIRLGPRFRFGPLHFEVEGPEDAGSTRTDTLDDSGHPMERITWRIHNDGVLRESLLLRSLRARPGDWFNQSQLLATKRRLEASAVFSFTDIESAPPVGNFLPHRIAARSRPRHRFKLEAFALQSSGALGGVGNEFGAGLGLSYENGSLFGNGELLRLASTGSIAADVDSTVFSSSQAEITTSLALPYLPAPLRRLDRLMGLYQARTRLSLSIITARREDLRLIIRGRGTARMRLEMQHAPQVTSFLDVLDISLSNPDTLGGFQERFLDRILGDDGDAFPADPVQRARILEDYTQPQINNALRYTVSAANVNLLRRSRGYSYEAAVEIGGNLPYMLDRYVFTPETVDGSLPGLPGLSGDGSSSRLNYRQYIRIVGDLRRYEELGPATVLAWKMIGGWAHPTGRARVVPFDRRFYSGGASSVRGWRLRGLGPGGATFETGAAANNTATNILGGDIKIEASIELRQSMLRDVLDAQWIIAFFVDAGNVWFGPRNPGFTNLGAGSPNGQFMLSRFYREMGVGTGLGLRLSWEYLVARFDFAVRAHDPAKPGGGLLPTGIRHPTAYFRIGHAF